MSTPLHGPSQQPFKRSPGFYKNGENAQQYWDGETWTGAHFPLQTSVRQIALGSFLGAIAVGALSFIAVTQLDDELGLTSTCIAENSLGTTYEVEC